MNMLVGSFIIMVHCQQISAQKLSEVSMKLHTTKISPCVSKPLTLKPLQLLWWWYCDMKSAESAYSVSVETR